MFSEPLCTHEVLVKDRHIERIYIYPNESIHWYFPRYFEILPSELQKFSTAGACMYVYISIY